MEPTISYQREPMAILAECAVLYAAGLYDPAYDIHGRRGVGLLCLYGRAIQEAETGIAALWVARCEGHPVGVAAVAGNHGDILHMFVHPAWRGRGIGHQLLTRVVRQHDGDLAVHYTAANFNFFNPRGLDPVDLKTFGALALAQVSPAVPSASHRPRPRR